MFPAKRYVRMGKESTLLMAFIASSLFITGLIETWLSRVK
jgi:hypothetical protein